MSEERTERNAHDRNRFDDAIVATIKKGNMKMRPRWHFIIRTVLVISVTVLLLLALLYFVSFIIFALHQNGIWFAAGFGLSGWELFLSALPWGLLALSFVLLLLVASLLNRYAFVYQHPFVYFMFAFIILIILGSFLIAATALHPGLESATQDVPILDTFYQSETAFPASVHRGEIVSFTDNSFIIESGSGMTSTVVAAAGVVFIDNFHVGDVVLVFGTRQPNGTIKAFGIQRIVAATSTGTAVSST